MSRKVRRVPVVLDAGEIRNLPLEDIRMILRGADELISTGGRSMLAKILKGSKDKKYKIKRCKCCGKMIEIKNKKDFSTKYCITCKKENRKKVNHNYYIKTKLES